jgi:hypothetical protein
MNRFLLSSLVLSAALAVMPTPSQACGEGAFNTGKGLAYQGYLAPRPATVLIYSAPDSTTSHADRDALYAGLKKAGHSLTIVTDADALTSALHDHQYDVVIASLDTVDAVEAATASVASKPHLLPVAARSERDSTQLHSRYKEFLVDGASLGQYLKTINSMVASSVR